MSSPKIAMSSKRPVPRPTDWDEGYWNAAKEHRLVVQCCSACARVRSLPRIMCPHCHAFEFHWVEASGHAKLYSWTTLWRTFHPAYSNHPMTVVLVELDDHPQVHLASQIDMKGHAESDLRIDMPVSVIFTPIGDGVVLPEFRVREWE